ncbi:MAG: WD40 repeat domain-containing protein [Ktedonobacteraceae bacterium]
MGSEVRRLEERRLASCGLDQTIRLWDPTTDTCVQVLRDLDAEDTVFFSVAWSPNGQFLASGTLPQGVLLWDMTTGCQRGADRSRRA